MFSGIMVIIIIAIVLDIIGKSIADKKKIEESKMRRMKNPKSRPITVETNSFPNEDRWENPIKEDEEYINPKITVMPSLAVDQTNLVENVKNGEVVKLNKDINTMKKKSGLNKRLKNDIIKGIIYSEILSEPKSIKNLRKDI